MQRRLKELTESQLDWKIILNNFIQVDVVDYTFMPPDRRFDESPFFLPDFNEMEESARDILFMIDTSGSVSDKEMTETFSEIKGAIEQFSGNLKGWLGFFDTAVYELQPFSNTEELMAIKPKGGGTWFRLIFDYVRLKRQQKPNMIIILTDGYAIFPPEEVAEGIPVLWVINNDYIDPPWGKVARMKQK